MKYGERFNTVSHLFALFFAFPSMIYLIALASKTGDLWKITSVSVYGTTLVALYYHQLFIMRIAEALNAFFRNLITCQFTFSLQEPIPHLC